MDVCIFCFCKQKPAYEMRISDWRSDVCSSDLRTHTSRRLDSVAALATVGQVVTAFDARRRLAHAGMPERLEQQPAGRTLKVSEFVLAGAVPLVAYALNRRRGGGSAGLSVAGSVSLLAGAWLFRHSLLKIGMESAKDQIGRAHV